MTKSELLKAIASIPDEAEIALETRTLLGYEYAQYELDKVSDCGNQCHIVLHFDISHLTGWGTLTRPHLWKRGINSLLLSRYRITLTRMSRQTRSKESRR